MTSLLPVPDDTWIVAEKWISLPNGISADGTRLRLTVFRTIRVYDMEARTLAAYPPVVDWPLSVPDGPVTVEFLLGDGSRADLVQAQRVSPPPELPLWQAMFPPSTPVQPFVFNDHSGQPIITFDAADLAQRLQADLTGVGAAWPADLPPLVATGPEPGLADVIGPASDWQVGPSQPPPDLAPIIEARVRAAADPAAFVQPHARNTVERMLMFHRRGAVPPPPDPGTVRDQFDFHQMLAVLGDHPELLRRLGVAFDIEFPAARVPMSNGQLSLRTYIGDPRFVPETSYFWNVAQFGPAFADGSPARGVIALPPEEFHVEQMDVDGTALKMVGLASTASNPSGPDLAGLPSVRTAGLTLVRTGRAAYLHADFVLAKQREDALAVNGRLVFTAEELVRGHRLDVLDETTGRWHSLHARDVSYSVLGFLDSTQTGEGFFQVSVADGGGHLYIHENIVTWNGWSLSAPRPGKVLPADPRAPDPAVPETLPWRPVNTAVTLLPLEIRTKVAKGSLPRLRFGHPYQIRVRTVDLAGNGPAVDEATPLQQAGDTLHTVFRRYEPVPAPALVPRAPFGAGASAHRMVVRSAPGQSPEEWLAASAPGEPYRAGDERHVVPPKTAMQLAEWHGMLDTAIGSRDPAMQQRVYEMARREKGALQEAGGYAVHPEQQLAVPYLPDPNSLSAVFHGLPGAAGPVQQDWRGDWPQLAPLRLRLTEGSGEPAFDETARVLTVQLPKAASATIRVSSRANVDPDLMAMARQCQERLSTAQFEQVMTAAKAAEHWMFTPWHELTLVHAVQRPLTAPDITMRTDRDPGDTGVRLSGTVSLDRPSTGQLDLVAEWQDIDDTKPDGPVYPVRRAAVLRQQVAREGGPQEPIGGRHEFGDTLHRTVTYHAVGTTAFREYFPPEDDPSRLLVEGGRTIQNVLASAPPLAPSVLYCLPTQRFDEPSPGVRRRRGGARVYVARPFFSSGDGEMLGVIAAGNDRSMVRADPTRFTSFYHPPDSPDVFTGEFTDEVLPDGRTVKAYRPVLAPEASAWFFDIDVDPPPQYQPFLRLTLVAYNPDALPVAKVSGTVQTDILQIPTVRTFTLTRDGGNLHVKVNGPVNVNALQPRLYALLEYLPAGSDDLTGWQLEFHADLTMTGAQPSPRDTEWTADLPGPQSGGLRHRLLVIEEEQLVPDDPSAGPTVGRIVYADTVDL